MAIYNLKDSKALGKFNNYVDSLIKSESMVDLSKVSPKRTNSQNSYLHVLFTLWGLEYGYTIEEAKILIKRYFAEIFLYKKNDQIFLRKTADFNTKEMTEFIDKLRTWSGINGCYLPTPAEYKGKYDYYMNYINSNKEYI